MSKLKTALPLLFVLVVGCQAAPPATPNHTAAPTGGMAAQTPQPSPAAWRTLTDDEGNALVLAEEPMRVVSLTPATTELLFALGQGDKLVGRTDFDDYPPEAALLPAVATFSGVLIEKVVELDPDLVIAGGNSFTPPGDVSRLRELGIPVLVIYATDVAGVLADIRLVGKAIGREPQAESIVAQIQRRIDEVASAVAALARPRVFYEIGNEPEIYGPAPNSFVADMVSLAGGEPITTTDPAVFSISLERLVVLDPEVVVLGDAAYGVCPDSAAGRPGWASMTAVRNGAVRPVDDIVVTRPGPRLGEGLAALARAIHPDAQIAAPIGATDYCAEPAAL